MNGKYATKTDVPVDRSRTEIERTLTRYGATHYGYINAPDRVTVAFQKDGRQVRFIILTPDRDDPLFTRTPTGRVASKSAADNAYDQAVKQRWRALGLVIKAKLEAVDAGISVFDEEFYAHLVLPNGRTVFEESGTQVQQMIDTGSAGTLMIEA